MAEIVIVSYSELDTFRMCPLKHALGYDQRWTREKTEDGALGKGTLWHKVLDTHYGIIKQWQDEAGGVIKPEHQALCMTAASQAALKHLFDPISGAQSPTQELILWMYQGYVEQYGIDREWRILATEHQIVVPLLDERGRRSRYHLKTKIDLIARNRRDGSLWLWDHKSGKDLPKQMDLEIDDQFGLYTWAMRQVGKPVIGSIHSANRTQRNVGPMTLASRMSRTYLNRSDVELTNLALDAYRAARAAHPPKSEKRPPYSAPDPRQCGWKCDFKEAHLLMRQGRKPQEVLLELGFRVDKTRH